MFNLQIDEHIDSELRIQHTKSLVHIDFKKKGALMLINSDTKNLTEKEMVFAHSLGNTFNSKWSTIRCFKKG